jgi:hypothetical protein
MKKAFIGIICALAMTANLWAGATGMPALDSLLADVAANGPVSKQLGFSDDQRKDIQKHIEKESKNLTKIRDEALAAEKKVERKEKKKADKTVAKQEKDAALVALNAARENAFQGLKPLMSGKQFEDLTKWRNAGRAKAN